MILVAACRQEPQPEPALETRYGNLRLSVGSSVFATKADSPDLAEGEAFEDVLVIITDDEGNVIDKVYKQYPYVPDPGDIQVAVTSGTPTNDEVYFLNMEVGTYQVYVYANTGHTEWQIAGETIATVEKELIASRDRDEDKLNTKRQLAKLSGVDTPVLTAASMLLTGHRSLSIGVDENTGEVELHRPVVRFNVYVHNHTPYELSLKSLSFSDFNASDTYLLDLETDSGLPQIPSGTQYRSLPAYNTSNPVTIPASEEEGEELEETRKLVYWCYLYENVAPSAYRMYATVDLKLSNTQTVSKELISKGVRLLPYSEIESMQAGESKTVFFCNPNTNNGRIFGIAGNSLSPIAATYNFEESYMTRAAEMLNWSSKDTYILTLTKNEDGRYFLARPGQPMFNNVPIGDSNNKNGESGLFLEEGFVPTNTNYPVSTEFSGYLSRFRDSQYRFLYNNSDKLYVHTTWSDRGNRMWAFYEVHPKGSDLKVIDNVTNQVSRLQYMRRNQELNVVMNVYFSEFERQFRFEVENAYWSEDNAHNPTHTFK